MFEGVCVSDRWRAGASRTALAALALVVLAACSDDGGEVADAPTTIEPVTTSTGVGAQQPPGSTSAVTAAPQPGSGDAGCSPDDPVECDRRLQAESLRQTYARVPEERCNVPAPASPSPIARVECDGAAGWRMYERSAGSAGASVLLQRWGGTWVTVREVAACADGVAWLSRRSLEQAGLPADLAARWGTPAARCDT